MRERLTIAKNYIESKTDFKPEVVIVLGSGFGDYGDTVDEVVAEFCYADIPGFPVSTAPGHAGKLTFGCKEGKKIALLSGRFHCYEGYTASETVVPLRTLLMLGAKYVLLTNAAGGVNLDFSAGDLMVITDPVSYTHLDVYKRQDFGIQAKAHPSKAYSPEYWRELQGVSVPLKSAHSKAGRHPEG